mmetsp:Transcript_42229/g.130868  ORF Transcript_42229/g.130868 Transcript_42229/m.130868 type:complete len:290 (+) Transcript_42229:70-939(+)
MDPLALVEALSALDAEAATQVISGVLRERPELAPAVVGAACPELTYAPSKAITERRSQGVIKSYSEKSGFGFISCPELYEVFGMDIFLHAKQMGMLGQGANVSFAVVLKEDNKPQAYDVQPWPPNGVGAGGGAAAGSWPALQQDPSTGGCWQVAPPWASQKGGGWGKGAACEGGKWGGGKGADGKGKKRKLEGPDLGQFQGMVNNFSEKDGFGFIVSEGLHQMGYQNDVFVHWDQLSGRNIGEQVSFTAFLNSKGQPQAKDLQPAGTDSGTTAGFEGWTCPAGNGFNQW